MTRIDNRAIHARIKREAARDHPCHARNLRDVSARLVHLHCQACGSHYWLGEWITPKQWEAYSDFCSPPSAKDLSRVRKDFEAASPEKRARMIEAHTWGLRAHQQSAHDWRPPKEAAADQQKIANEIDLLEWMLDSRRPVQGGLFA